MDTGRKDGTMKYLNGSTLKVHSKADCGRTRRAPTMNLTAISDADAIAMLRRRPERRCSKCYAETPGPNGLDILRAIRGY